MDADQGTDALVTLLLPVEAMNGSGEEDCGRDETCEATETRWQK